MDAYAWQGGGQSADARMYVGQPLHRHSKPYAVLRGERSKPVATSAMRCTGQQEIVLGHLLRFPEMLRRHRITTRAW
jgi:hypothetical protein